MDDYTVDGISLSAPSHTLTLPAGQLSLTATIAAVSDRVVEGAETLTIAASHGGTEFATQTVTIAASDAPAFTVSVSPSTIGEGESTTLRVEIENNVTFATAPDHRHRGSRARPMPTIRLSTAETRCCRRLTP